MPLPKPLPAFKRGQRVIWHGLPDHTWIVESPGSKQRHVWLRPDNSLAHGLAALLPYGMLEAPTRELTLKEPTKHAQLDLH